MLQAEQPRPLSATEAGSTGRRENRRGGGGGGGGGDGSAGWLAADHADCRRGVDLGQHVGDVDQRDREGGAAGGGRHVVGRKELGHGGEERGRNLACNGRTRHHSVRTLKGGARGGASLCAAQLLGPCSGQQHRPVSGASANWQGGGDTAAGSVEVGGWRSRLVPESRGTCGRGAAPSKGNSGSAGRSCR